jgi:hypothetical protein
VEELWLVLEGPMMLLERFGATRGVRASLQRATRRYLTGESCGKLSNSLCSGWGA